LEGGLDGKRLERTFNRLIQRHEALRTSFVPVDDEPVQRIHDNVEFAIEGRGGSPCPPFEVEKIVQKFIRPFDLSCAPLFRVLLPEVSRDRYILVVGVHHMVSDGSSVGLLLKECMALYDGEGLPGLRIQYKDYSAWKLDTEHRASIVKQEEYWLEQFKEEVPVLNLPSDYDRPAVKSSEGLAVNLPLGIEETGGLKQLALREGTTLYMVLAAVFNVLLAKLTGVEDIVIGTPAAGRSHTDLEPLMGMFVNTLVLRNYPLGARTFKDFLGEVKQRILTVFTNQEYNFEDLVRQVVSTRDVSRNPIFDVFFALQNMEIPEVQISGLHLRPYNIERKVARFDLSFIFTEAGTRLWIYAEYCTQLFRRETVERFIEFFRKIAVSVVKDPVQKISDLEIISGEEKQQILYHFNDTYSEYPGEKTIHELFVEQAEKRPDGVSLVGKGERAGESVQLTFRELNNNSDQLGHLLREKGVGPDTIVGLKIERSIEMIIGIMGILKAGGAYLPIDTTFPQERIDFMLNDSNTGVLVSEVSELSKVSEGTGVTHLTHPTQLCYVIYTSGTTGKPRAILTTHANVVRVVRNTNYIEFTEKDRVLQLSNYAFDGSVFDIYGALLNGAALVMVGEAELMALNRLGDLIRREAVTVFFVTTALFNALVDENINCLVYTRKILFGGERVSKDHARRALRYLGKDRVIHVYGPTETTVYASYYFINSIDEKRSTIPIGGPISNTALYILDKYMNPVPPGIAGEIYIGGAGIARGYLNNPELTAEKFCLRRPGGRFLKKLPPWTPRKNFSLEESNDQCPMTNDRLYRTGDLACWLAGGVVEFIGRIDQQIKIRGFRVELGEIEGRLLKHDGVKEAVVLARGGSGADKFLCAYIVSAGIEARELKEFLSLELPGYMVPAYFVFLDKIPLTPNGKVDKRGLPVPDSGAAKNKYTAPRDQVEEKLAEIWSGVFGISPIGIDDNFFELGGHSLKATLMISRIHRVFHVNLSLVDFFKNPTIRQLANYTGKAGQEGGLIIRAVEKRDTYPLSAAQRRLYFLHCLHPRGTAYNVPIRLQLQGRIDIPLMEESFRKLVQRHESLRTSFVVKDGDPVQRVYDEVKFKIEGRGGPPCPPFEVEKIIQEFVRPFDLANAPLMRVGLIKTGEDEHVFSVDMHHIVSDGTSMLLLVSEFMTLYGTGNDKKESLPEMRIRYKDYCLWQNSRKLREIIKKQEAYWLNRFKGKIEELELPMDYPRPEIKSNQGAYEGFEVDAGAARELRALAIKENATMFMVILAVFDILLFKLSRQEDIVVGTANAGRVHQDLENIVGMFVNTLALRNHPKNEKSFIEFLREVGETTLEAFDNQDYQFEDLVEKVLEKRDPGRNPLFDVMFMFGKLDIIIDISQFSSVFTNKIGTVGPGESILKVKPYRSGNPPAKFDMLFTGTDTGEKLVFSIGYCTDLFKKETIERFITYFKEIVAEVKDNESILLKDISISHNLVTAKSDLYLDRESDFEF
jgi:amino acid adenylation domain-containing protein